MSFGHDAFLIGDSQAPPLRQRLGAFLSGSTVSAPRNADGVDRVRALARGFDSD